MTDLIYYIIKPAPFSPVDSETADTAVPRERRTACHNKFSMLTIRDSLN